MVALPPDAVGLVGDRYALSEVIGRGGMADVYRGTDTVLGREVAVKVLRETAGDSAERARFVAEARTLARMSQAGLVAVLDAGTTADRPFLVMELVDGTSLDEWCAGTALDTAGVLAIGTQLADALSHVHASGVVHRDVKPSNVLVGSGGQVWLTDFGIARLLADTARHTRTGMTIGSPAYLAPEQVRGLEVGPAADVYSLGLVLLELLTGRRAYPQAPTEAALARLTSPPVIPEDVPEGLGRLLASMTDTDPERRPTAQSVAARLRELSADGADAAMTAVLADETAATRPMPAAATPTLAVPVVAPPVTDGQRRTTGVTSGRRSVSAFSRRPGLGIILAAVAVLALVLGLSTLREPGPGSEGRVDVPAGVPGSLEQPLQDLHDAVNGEGQ